MSDSDVCGGSEGCQMRPTQAMDDSGGTQVLGLLSEPSLPTTEGKEAGGGMMEGGREGGRPASSVQTGTPKGALKLQFPAPPVFLNVAISEKDYLLYRGPGGATVFSLNPRNRSTKSSQDLKY